MVELRLGGAEPDDRVIRHVTLATVSGPVHGDKRLRRSFDGHEVIGFFP